MQAVTARVAQLASHAVVRQVLTLSKRLSNSASRAAVRQDLTTTVRQLAEPRSGDAKHDLMVEQMAEPKSGDASRDHEGRARGSAG